MLKKIIPDVSIGVCYVVLSLLIGECHPFSKESMYDSFPDRSYTFYLSDTRGQLLPLKKYYHFTTNELTHVYNAICESRDLNGDREAEQMQSIGMTLMEELNRRRFAAVPTDSIQLHQVNYFLQNDSIHTKDILMYETGSR